MPNLKITYFDIDGGRAEPARLALHICSVAFEDFRFPFTDFAKVRKTTPLSQVPTMHLGDKQVTQCNAILRYIGKLTGLYPQDGIQALYCDEILDALEDVTNKLVATFTLQGEELKQARVALVEGALTKYLTWLDMKLAEANNDYFCNNALTIADLKVFVWIRTLNSGILDHIPTTLVAQIAPALNNHMARIAKHPSIAEYYSARG